MENIVFNIPNQELNKALSNVSSESKNQVIELVDHELLNDEELAAISGGDWDFSGLGDAIKASGDFVASIYHAGEDFGDSVSDYFGAGKPC